jgi:nucleotide-binding universal stress UspA family protein
LAELAESGNFDLVVVGSKGRGAVSRMLVGSITDRLVHICKRPVLVVR